MSCPVLAILLLELAAAAAWPVPSARAGPPQDAPAAAAVFRVSVYPDSPAASPPEFSADPLAVLSARPLESTRPLLIIVDPTSAAGAEFYRRTLSVVQVLSRRAARAPAPEIRIGITALGGILSDPLPALGNPVSRTEAWIRPYFTEAAGHGQRDLARTLDLIAGLLERAEAGGVPVDCLVIAADGRIEGDDAAYFSSGFMRLLAEACSRRGSTLYGYLAGTGLLAEICRFTGGLAIPDGEPAEAVIDGIFEARKRGYLLELQAPGEADYAGLMGAGIRARASDGAPLGVRAPRAFWRAPDGSPAPDYYRLREAAGWARRAAGARGDGNPALALRLLKSSLDHDPWNPQALLEAARAAAELQELAEALDLVERAARCHPPSEAALALFCDLALAAGRPEKALAALERARRAGAPVTAALELSAGRLLRALGRDEEARRHYAAALAAGEDSDSAHAEYGSLLWRLGDPEGAAGHVRDALARNPRNVTAWICTSEIAAARGNLAEALESAHRAREIEPANPEAHAQAARVELARGEWAQALTVLDTALALAPARRDLLYLLADAQSAGGQLGAAAETLKRILAADPADARAYRRLADLHVRGADLPQAASVLEAGAAHAPGQAYAFYRSAVGLRERAGEFGQALLDYRAMLSALPEEQAAALERRLSAHMAGLSLSLDPSPPTAGPARRQAEDGQPPLSTTRPPAAGGAQPSAGGLIVPGGLEPLARVLGIEAGAMREDDALERIFSHILEISPAGAGSRPAENPLCRDVLSHLRQYRLFVRHLEQRKLLPAGCDPKAGHELTFVISGDEAELARTRELLSFFGIKVGLTRSQQGDPTVTLTIKGGRKWDERRRLLRHLGVNIPDPGLREIRFAVRDEELPARIDAATLGGKLFGSKPASAGELLERFMQDQEAMRLYMALAGCSSAARGALIRTLSAAEFRALAPALANFGRYLDVEGGRLAFPGSREAWEKFLGIGGYDADGSLAALVRRDGGKALLLYYALRIAPATVREYFTASESGLSQLYSLLLPLGGSSSPDPARGTWRTDPARIIRQLDAGDHGIVLPVERSLGRLLFPAGTSGKDGPEAAPGPFPTLATADLALLLERAGDSRPSPYPGITEILEFLRYFSAQRSEPLSEAGAAALTRDAGAVPAFLDLVWDLELPQELIVEYVDYCRLLAGAGAKSWNVNRTRTSQSLFFLLAAFRREQTLGRDESLELFRRALERLQAADETEFALNAAAFLARDLLPALGARLGKDPGADSLIEAALAGRHPAQEFFFEGRRIRFDPSAYALKRMKAAVQRQNFLPLPALLDALQVLAAMAGGSEPKPVLLRRLSDHLKRLPPADTSGAAPSRGPAARADIDMLRKRLDRLAGGFSGARSEEAMAQLAGDLAGALHLELGVTLLAHCYAYSGAPEVDALAFDPDFVRKHEFYPDAKSPAQGWLPARLQVSPEGGVRIAGSLSGLSYQLARLETAQSAQGFGKRDAPELLPSILAGLRAMRHDLLTDRASEYVALTVRLGREILARSLLDEDLWRWCSRQVGFLTSALRREEVARALGRGDSLGAAALLAPSELFFLGESYLRSSMGAKVHSKPAGHSASGRDRADAGVPVGEGASGDADAAPPAGAVPHEAPPEMECPNLDRLIEIVSAAGPAGEAGLRRETDQYGALLRNRLGLDQLSISISDSYEQLEHTMGGRLLYERICDLKIRIAEINYSLGLPAFLLELEGGLALRDILPRTSAVHANPWKVVLGRIAELGSENARAWIEELLNREVLTVAVEEDRK